MSERPRLRVVDLFCGCGGWAMGLHRAANDLGIEVEVVAAYDSWPKAVEIYNRNAPHPVAVVRDLKTMQRSELPPHDLVIGGPPCQDHSMAGKRACKCNVGGPATERCCLKDFVRLAGDSPYVMENVVSRLINAPWSEKLCAADFGDVTSRKRWFFSNYLLHVIPTPGPRRIRDIRDHAEDERVLKKRGLAHQLGIGNTPYIVTHRPRTNAQGCEPYAAVALDSEVFGSLTSDVPRAFAGETLRLGLRGNSQYVAAPYDDDDILGSITGQAWYANEASRIVACRNPSLLEMARAHSIPDSFDWCGATKSDKGRMVANSVPCGLAAGVSSAMLRSLVSERLGASA